MNLHTVGTSSKGNCYFLRHDNDMLMLDAGVGMSEIYKSIDHNIKSIDACLLSHSHL